VKKTVSTYKKDQSEKGKDGDIEYENIEKKNRGHRNGNIEKLLKSGEL
jgi:hypothetical protein